MFFCSKIPTSAFCWLKLLDKILLKWPFSWSRLNFVKYSHSSWHKCFLWAALLTFCFVLSLGLVTKNSMLNAVCEARLGFSHIYAVVYFIFPADRGTARQIVKDAEADDLASFVENVLTTNHTFVSPPHFRLASCLKSFLINVVSCNFSLSASLDSSDFSCSILMTVWIVSWKKHTSRDLFLFQLCFFCLRIIVLDASWRI